MVQVTATSQLSIFSTLRTIIKANSTLAVKFNDSNILQYEPKWKSVSFCGFPYIVIKIPSTEDEFILLNHSETDKSFDVEIIMYMDYFARENFLSYANALIYQVEASESTLAAAGYNNAEINVRAVEEVVEDNKDLIKATFIYSSSGWVSR